MLVHPSFDPVAFSLGPLAVRWYGLMYLAGFLLFLLLGRRRARQGWRGVSPAEVDDLLFYGIIAVIAGGRLGFCLFYQPLWFLTHPLEMLMVWRGGMSAHGGMVGAFLALLLYAHVRGRDFWGLADFCAPLVPLGLGLGRIGNFINGELWGRVAAPGLPWAMVFPGAGDALPRHPSQLYEAGLEGAALFVILWWASARPRGRGLISALFCLGYGLFRFCVEWFREPDAFLGPGWLGWTRGQWLTLPLALTGLAILALVWWPARRAR